MKVLFVWFNFDGYIKVIEKNILMAFDALNIEYKSCYIEELTDTLKNYDPIFVVFFHPNKLIYNFVEQIKEMKCHKLLWDMESPYESDIVFDMLPYIYYIFTSDKATARELEKESTANKIFFVPHACNPEVHKKIEYKDLPFEYKSDYVLVGNAYESRLKFLEDNEEKFRNLTLTVIGVGYWGMKNLQNQRFIRHHVSEEECIKYYNGAKIVLNPHRINTDLDMANKRNIVPEHLNNRFYELSAMGINQWVENRDNMKDEIEKVQKQKPEDYSYVSRLRDFFVPLLKK